ncbi:coiled-coil domain-containing protein [Campylobacter concisus]|uniref:coiled-coil domain-containing protein n=1 Tax=Campylobacter concisus TaxID=199 RepID=UPI000CD8E2F6|nr:hypothetical protein [Campylobacter concisus]
MSRWMTRYESSDFHSKWELFKTKFSEFNIKEIVDIEIIDEYNRLGKVIIFIDSYLKLIDPELSPENLLDNSISYLESALNYFNSFINNGTVNYIRATNDYIDQLVNGLKNLNILIPKISSRSVSNMLQEYTDTIKKALEDINLEKIKEDVKEIYRLKNELIDGENSIEDSVKDFFDEIKEKYTKIAEFHDETLIDEKDYISTKTEILEAKKDILNDINLTKKHLTETNKDLEDLEKFYVKIFGKFDEEEGKRIGGLEQELATRKKELEEFKNDQINKLNELREEHGSKHKAFEEEIEKLLEGATSAGLAEAYSIERKKFIWPIRIWNGVFVVCLFAISILSFSTLKNLSSIEEIAKSILHSLPITLPLIWVAVYASKRRSENQRLEQEYAHKEALSRSYISYKKQISELGKEDSELLEKLILEAINTISYNASKTLDKKHGDGTILNEITQSIKNLSQRDTK